MPNIEINNQLECLPKVAHLYLAHAPGLPGNTQKALRLTLELNVSLFSCRIVELVQSCDEG
ncbi:MULTISPECIES: hypothetical protein [unclassified Mesorhizobium]|uniref:hypothetical protein n=1 Tax=unclassified Mesorhizobium TaxID=325217 RepID=UPI00121A44F3|nr:MULTISPECIES: hypothetical protein [unclassified Mesorhizobium]TIW77784.1 MAG: hypothetical protein E5V53_24525 [Mesorhizobium sp.]